MAFEMEPVDIFAAQKDFEINQPKGPKVTMGETVTLTQEDFDKMSPEDRAKFTKGAERKKMEATSSFEQQAAALKRKLEKRAEL